MDLSVTDEPCDNAAEGRLTSNGLICINNPTGQLAQVFAGKTLTSD